MSQPWDVSIARLRPPAECLSGSIRRKNICLAITGKIDTTVLSKRFQREIWLIRVAIAEIEGLIGIDAAISEIRPNTPDRFTPRLVHVGNQQTGLF
jgi:hypothetical protein